MKKVPFVILLLGGLAAVCWFSFYNTVKTDQGPKFISSISPEHCVLCAKLDSMDENNLFLFDINTFSVSPIPILRYDPRGVKLDGPFSTVTAWSIHTDGITGSGLIHSDRQFASGPIKFDGYRGIDSDSISALYCQPCLDHMQKTVYAPSDLYGIGIMNTTSKEVRLLESSITGFSLGDYYVQSIPYSDNDIYLTLIYAPISE